LKDISTKYIKGFLQKLLALKDISTKYIKGFLQKLLALKEVDYINLIRL